MDTRTKKYAFLRRGPLHGHTHQKNTRFFVVYACDGLRCYGFAYITIQLFDARHGVVKQCKTDQFGSVRIQNCVSDYWQTLCNFFDTRHGVKKKKQRQTWYLAVSYIWPMRCHGCNCFWISFWLHKTSKIYTCNHLRTTCVHSAGEVLAHACNIMFTVVFTKLFDARNDLKKRCQSHRSIRVVKPRCHIWHRFWRKVWRQKAFETHWNH